MVAQLPWLDQMCGCEEDAEDNADPAYHDVGDAEEGILAADDSGGRDDDRFRATVLGYVEVWGCLLDFQKCGSGRGRGLTMVNVNAVGSWYHIYGIIPLCKFAESRQASQTHPDLEGFVISQIREVFITVAIRISFDPVWWHSHL